MQQDAMALFEAAVIEFASLLKDASFPLQVTTTAQGGNETTIYVPTVTWVKFQGSLQEALESIKQHGLAENWPLQTELEQLTTRGLSSGFDA